MVQPVFPVFPKLDPLWRHAIAAPMRRAGNILPLITGTHLFKAGFEHIPVTKRLLLERGPSAKL